MSALADAVIIVFALWGAWQLVKLWDEHRIRRANQRAADYLRTLGELHDRWHR